MIFLWIKAIHVAAVLIWVGGLMAVSVGLSLVTTETRIDSEQSLPLIGVLRRWDARVTAPALAVVWLLGITLAVMTSWFWTPWLVAKMLIVFALSGLHASVSGTLRRLASDPGYRPNLVLRLAAPITVAAVTAIAILVEIKPG